MKGDGGMIRQPKLRSENIAGAVHECAPLFVCELERGLLLELKACGKLSENEYRRAEQKLRQCPVVHVNRGEAR